MREGRVSHKDILFHRLSDSHEGHYLYSKNKHLFKTEQLNLFLSFLNTVQKNSDTSRIQTGIIRVKGKDADHYAITTF